MTNNLYWKLDCEYVEGNDDSAGRSRGLAAITLEISHFEGVEKNYQAQGVSDEVASSLLIHLGCRSQTCLILQRGAQAACDAGGSLKDLIKMDPATGLKILPHWLAQSYFGSLPTPDFEFEEQPEEKLRDWCVIYQPTREVGQ
jgi:hypothetical protein